MPRITYVDTGGTRRDIDAAVSDSVMQTAVRNGVPGIIGECGGNSTCGTCHVYVDESCLDLAGPPNDLEEDMLDMATTDRRQTSRLSCQIRVTSDFEGFRVFTPEVQP